MAKPAGHKSGFVSVVEGDAPEGKRYLRTVSFRPFVQRTVTTAAGQTYQVGFQARAAGDEPSALAVYWNDERMKLFSLGTREWRPFTLRVRGTGKNVLKFQRTGRSNLCLDAIRVQPVPSAGEAL